MKKKIYEGEDQIKYSTIQDVVFVLFDFYVTPIHVKKIEKEY
ncbi:hypothetical protein [Arenibacter arenosicollis]|nr:hypothetical protein [Arenibacter arenosicollis]